MRRVVAVLVMLALALLVVGAGLMAVMWVGRVASDVVTTVEVIAPEPGVRCAKMLTTEGAAISCWTVPDGGK